MKLKKILLITNICLTGALVWLGINTYATWDSDRLSHGEPQAEALTRERQNGPPKRALRTGKDYRLIVSKDIFGTSPNAVRAPQKQEKKEEEEIVTTDLDVELKGTIVGENGTSYAIISQGRKKGDEIFGMNDSISGAKIVEIYTDKVILSRNGRREALPLSFESSKPSTRKTSPRLRPSQSPRTPTKRPDIRRRPVRAPAIP